MGQRLVGENTARKIGKVLKDLKVSSGINSRYVEARTEELVGLDDRVSNSTAHRILKANGNIGRLEYRTAKTLATFIEVETKGQIEACSLFDGEQRLESVVNSVDFSQATIVGGNWERKDLRFANLTGASLIDVDLSNAQLEGAQLNDAKLIGCNFDDAKFVGASLQRVTAEHSTFKCADLRATDWRYSHLIKCHFGGCSHSAVDMRYVDFDQTFWLADHYRGGLHLTDSNIDGLLAITPSHGVIKEIFKRIARKRRKFEMLAGWTETRFMGCWQAFLHLMNDGIFDQHEREEVFNELVRVEGWNNTFRLEYELLWRELLLDEFGCDFLDWPDQKIWRNVLEGKRVEVMKIKGIINTRGQFVPDDYAGDPNESLLADDFLRCVSDKLKIVAA